MTGAAVALRHPAPPLAALAFAALNQFPPDTAKAIELYIRALEEDPASPYRWSDLGFAYQSAQDIAKARYCYSRALALSGALPAIWLRDANFHFALGEPEDALLSAAKVLKTVPDYDRLLFGYFDRFGLPVESVLSQIGNDPRATRSYIRYLLETNKPAAAELVWKHAFAKGFPDGTLANDYVGALLQDHRYAAARRAWVDFLGSRRGDYPDQNLLFNAGFENDPSGSELDWMIPPSADFDSLRDQTSVHDGSWSLHVIFHGTGNVSYKHALQMAVIGQGKYVLRAWVRTEGITTDECPRIEVLDPEAPARLGVSTPGFCGTSPWKLVSLPFQVAPGTNLAMVRMVRSPSQKFDNKIAGSLWVDTLALTRE